LPEDPGLNPARVEGFKGKHGNAVVNIDLMWIVCGIYHEK
jgi:hypothetical protein